MTYSQRSENKWGIALLSCPICPKIRCGSLHDLPKKRHLLDPVGANAHTAQWEAQPASCTQKKKRVTVKLHVPICMRMAPFMFMRKKNTGRN